MSTADEQRASLIRRIYNINETDFDSVAMDVFRYQYHHNALYRSFCILLGREAGDIMHPEEIPHIPIVMFREHQVKTGHWEEEVVFRSSGTTGNDRSQHFIRDLDFYYHTANLCFSSFYGDPADYAWIGLLPSYLERPDSSLIHMTRHFMNQSRQVGNAFFPRLDYPIIDTLKKMRERQQNTMLMGVSFALLDLFENYDVPVWNNLIVMETGGMKGRGKEITREELYARIRKNNPEIQICSEYGMTELMSQAYTKEGLFSPGPTLKVRIRDISDPLQWVQGSQRGLISITDLSNIDSCAFIATDDIGTIQESGGFNVLGRFDHSDLRGCNLMYASA